MRFSEVPYITLFIKLFCLFGVVSQLQMYLFALFSKSTLVLTPLVFGTITHVSFILET